MHLSKWRQQNWTTAPGVVKSVTQVGDGFQVPTSVLSSSNQGLFLNYLLYRVKIYFLTVTFIGPTYAHSGSLVTTSGAPRIANFLLIIVFLVHKLFLTLYVKR